MSKKNYFIILFLSFFSSSFLSSINEKENNFENLQNKIAELKKSISQAKQDLDKTHKIAKISGITTITYFFCRGKKNSIRFLKEIPSFPKLDTVCSYFFPIVSILCTLQAEKQSNVFSDLQSKLCYLQTENISGQETTIKNLQDDQNTKLLKEIENKESELESLGEKLHEKNQNILNLETNMASLEEEINNLKIKLAQLEKKIDLTIFFKSLEDNYFQEKHIQWMQNPENIEAFNTLLSDSLTQSDSSFAASLEEAMRPK